MVEAMDAPPTPVWYVNPSLKYGVLITNSVQ